ncbi:hypothetical protein LF296_15585 [Acinetobacter vivianii]|uniref:Uncharacterized protein n=1 Tax=Acinetobacter vivianii TaxID=1776742 RepID=A0AAJ6NHX8_9GAMM|nr:hypothetical protein [Acinetobacter vivianii]WDZ50714.1 hypothetical protein LF296_15585 [Acinetobacter vivianii]
MKINYYCYCVEDLDTREKYNFDIKPLVKTLTDWKTSIGIAGKIVRGGESLFLLPVSTNYYLFVQTKTNEVIKKIEKKPDSINASEIVNMLSTNESLGFASYVLFDQTRNLFAFSSRMYSPKVTAFQHFFNDVFMLLGLGRLSFVVEPMKDSMSKTNAMKLPFIGKTRLMVNKDHQLFDHIANMLVGQASDRDVIAEMEVIIKPSPRKNVSQSMARVLHNTQQTGLEGIIIRAKENVEDQLKDIYISSSGAIFDEVDSIEEGIVYSAMTTGLLDNQLLAQKVSDHERTIGYTNKVLNSLITYYDANNWPTL